MTAYEIEKDATSEDAAQCLEELRAALETTVEHADVSRAYRQWHEALDKRFSRRKASELFARVKKDSDRLTHEAYLRALATIVKRDREAQTRAKRDSILTPLFAGVGDLER